MRKPNPKNLKVNKAQTKRIRSAMAKNKSVKITINIDADTLTKLRAMADETGVPYQRLINRTLTESLVGKKTLDARLKKLEKELNSIKKKIAA